MDTPVTRVSDPAEAVEAVLSGKESYLFLTGTKIEPEDWRYQLVIRNDQVQVFAIRDVESEALIGFVNQEIKDLLIEYAYERIAKEREALEARLERLDNIEERMQGRQKSRIEKIRAILNFRLEILKDLIPWPTN